MQTDNIIGILIGITSILFREKIVSFLKKDHEDHHRKREKTMLIKIDFSIQPLHVAIFGIMLCLINIIFITVRFLK